ncbi:MAG: hypothetical protein V1921_02830 [Candidatus Altiarchaeota archaeon]
MALAAKPKASSSENVCKTCGSSMGKKKYCIICTLIVIVGLWAVLNFLM